MEKWYRVFCGCDAEPNLAELPTRLGQLDRHTTIEVQGDDRGWISAELVSGQATWRLDRYLTEDEGLRVDLNAWAAWLETIEDNPQSLSLMQQIISTRQLITFRQMTETNSSGDQLPEMVCRFIAQSSAGIYQIDDEGIFATDGTLLVKE